MRVGAQQAEAVVGVVRIFKSPEGRTTRLSRNPSCRGRHSDDQAPDWIEGVAGALPNRVNKVAADWVEGAAGQRPDHSRMGAIG